MHFLIIAVGKIKEKFIQQAINEYLKRLTSYAKVKIVEVKDESFSEPLSQAEIDIVKEKEGQRILKYLPQRSFTIVLDQRGKLLSSEDVASTLAELAVSGQSQICFIIGGALGLSKNVLCKADLVMSFSKLTFPHQLIRLMLLEQIYRGMTINRGEKYHK